MVLNVWMIMNDYQLDPVDVSVERYNMDTEVVVVDVDDDEERRSVTDVHDAMVNVTSAIVVEIVVHMVMMTDDDEGAAY